MATISVIPPFPVFFAINGEPLENGSVYIGTANLNPLIEANRIATYSDSTLLIPVAQPIKTSGGYLMNSNGSPVQVYVGAADYSIVILDRNGALVHSSPTNKTKLGLVDLSTDVTGTLLSTFIKYDLTIPEVAAAVVVADYSVPNHDDCGVIWVDRYKVNAAPGTTDMGPALQAAINVALVVIGSGRAGPPIRFRAGAYSIATAPNFGGGADWLPIDVAGQGLGTQLINNCAAGSSALFPMAGCDGWYLHDFLMCGNSVNANIGIQVNTNPGIGTIGWKIARVFSMMAGVGIYMADTNTGMVEEYSHWFGNNPTLIVPQVVNAADISHGVYLTGSFCHNIQFKNLWCNGHSGYGGGAQRGLKMDCAFSFGVSIDGAPLSQTISGLNNDIGIEIAPTNFADSLVIKNLYLEGATLILNGVQNSEIGPITNGTIGGAVQLTGATRNNRFAGISAGIIDIFAPAGIAEGNLFIGCTTNNAVAWVNTTPYQPGNYVLQGGQNYRCIAANTNQVPPNVVYWTAINSFQDDNEAVNLSSQPNEVISSFGVHHVGYMWRKLLAYSANITMSVFGPNHHVIRVTNNVAFTINAPTNPRNGAEVTFTIRNESGGAMGVITWTGIGVAGWVNPANGFNRSICAYYDSDFNHWRQKWVGTADVAN